MELKNCYNCGENQHTFYAEENGFSIMKCSRCGLLYLKDRPDDSTISQAHKQGIHTGLKHFNVTGSFDSGKVSRYKGILKDLFGASISGKKTWLDIGCGHGELLAAVQQYSQGSISIRGSEPNIFKQKQAIKKGLNVDYFDIESHGEIYDVISMLNVWSHLPNPPKFVETLKRLLNPRGELIIQTGDTARFSPEDHYRPFYLPDHLSFASEKIVSDILERAGFQILNVHKYPFLPIRLSTVLKEIIKVFLPNYSSRIVLFLNYKKYSKTDMFIRARIKD